MFSGLACVVKKFLKHATRETLIKSRRTFLPVILSAAFARLARECGSKDPTPPRLHSCKLFTFACSLHYQSFPRFDWEGSAAVSGSFFLPASLVGLLLCG